MRPTLSSAGVSFLRSRLAGTSHLSAGPSSTSTWREKPRIAPASRGFSIIDAVGDASHFWPDLLSHRFTSASKAVLFKELGLSETREVGRKSATPGVLLLPLCISDPHTLLGFCLGKSEGIVLQGAQIYVGEGD